MSAVPPRIAAAKGWVTTAVQSGSLSARSHSLNGVFDRSVIAPFPVFRCERFTMIPRMPVGHHLPKRGDHPEGSRARAGQVIDRRLTGP
ncbi:hypothetical protein GCM10010116_02730 [Microbispora rosea subsp. aerata]|nr:hypothetical protein GCM10010116_02730 [Microbispora rosea subsp. aerata]GIH58355.1 hypothetical protein Mro02_52690 [Microbispora rosea subsp. aerata]GLJ87133.1 hypothetical protein GCM10017588_58770 [Microbispora rosea subsp. aerata]